MHPRTTRTLGALAIAAALVPLAACQPVAGGIAVTSGATVAASAPAAAATTPAAASTTAGGGAPASTGQVSLRLTEPVAFTGAGVGTVSCRTGRTYTAAATGVTADGYQIDFTVRVAPYTGAGSYPALVTLKVNGPAGGVAGLAGVPNVAAQITATGGSFSVSATGENGRTVAGSLNWTCS
jgi:hypothetical protein